MKYTRMQKLLNDLIERMSEESKNSEGVIEKSDLESIELIGELFQYLIMMNMKIENLETKIKLLDKKIES